MLQGVPFEKRVEMTQKLCSSDLILVKPKRVYHALNIVVNVKMVIFSRQTHFGFTNNQLWIRNAHFLSVNLIKVMRMTVL